MSLIHGNLQNDWCTGKVKQNSAVKQKAATWQANQKAHRKTKCSSKSQWFVTTEHVLHAVEFGSFSWLQLDYLCQLNQGSRNFCPTTANHQSLVLGSTARTLQKHPLPSRTVVCGGRVCKVISRNQAQQVFESLGGRGGGGISYCETSFSNAS